MLRHTTFKATILARTTGIHATLCRLYAQLLQKEARPNKRLGALMTCLENSPVLCAYGLMRSGCTAPVRPVTPTAGRSQQPLGHNNKLGGSWESAGQTVSCPCRP